MNFLVATEVTQIKQNLARKTFYIECMKHNRQLKDEFLGREAQRNMKRFLLYPSACIMWGSRGGEAFDQPKV